MVTLICINCEYHGDCHVCCSPNNEGINMVTGKPFWIIPLCFDQRSEDISKYPKCGKEGRWFKWKENKE